MHDQNAAQLLAKVMGWSDLQAVSDFLPKLQLLAEYKYDHYQRFGPGRRFVESLALWLNQFLADDRQGALKLVMDRLIYLSEAEMAHLVRIAYPDLIVQERMRLVAEEYDIALHRVGEIARHPRFKELQLKSLYLGLSDGARSSELRRASDGEIGNEQIWQAYELGEEKAADMLDELKKSLTDANLSPAHPKFNLIWLIDDFSGSGNTYIRYDSKKKTFKGKIVKIFERMLNSRLIDPSHYDVFLLLYAATRQAIDHIEYWAGQFTSEHGYKPLQIKVLCPIEPEVSLTNETDAIIKDFLSKMDYYDNHASDKHIAVGGTQDARLGFAGCALPLVLAHNTPNNSIYLLWGPQSYRPFGLFPRVSRHREF